MGERLLRIVLWDRTQMLKNIWTKQTIQKMPSFFFRELQLITVGFLRFPPSKFVEQIVWFFSFLISVLFDPFFFQYILVYSFIYYILIVIIGIFLTLAL